MKTNTKIDQKIWEKWSQNSIGKPFTHTTLNEMTILYEEQTGRKNVQFREDGQGMDTYELGLWVDGTKQGIVVIELRVDGTSGGYHIHSVREKEHNRN